MGAVGPYIQSAFEEKDEWNAALGRTSASAIIGSIRVAYQTEEAISRLDIDLSHSLIHSEI
jgi:hypothetical protein